MKKILYESYFALVVCAVAGMLAGIFLSSMADIFVSLPGLLIIIPGALAMRGSIFGSLSARLGTYLHSGQVDAGKIRSPLMTENVLAAISQTLLLSSALGLLAYLFIPHGSGGAYLLGSLLLVSVLAGLLAGAVLIVVTIITVVGGFRKGWDPDNITAPIITTSGDIFTIPCVLVSARLVMSMEEGTIIALSILVIVLAVLFNAFFAPGNRNMRTILKQSLPVLLLCALLATIAGHFLEARLEALILVSGLFILFPPFNQTAGNLGAILSARLSSAAHLGTTKIGRIPDRTGFQNMAAIFLLLLMIFPCIGVLAHVVSISMGFASPGLSIMVTVSVLGGLIMSVAILLMSYYFTYFSYRMSVNPDNVVIPLLTSTADALGVFVLLGMFAVMGVV